MKIGRIEITASRWPWQEGANWQGLTDSRAPLNQPKEGKTASPRFGAGWSYKLGFAASNWKHIHFDLLFGSVSVSYRPICPLCGKPIYRKQMRGPLVQFAEGLWGYDVHRTCYDKKKEIQ